MDNPFNIQDFVATIDKVKVASEGDVDVLCVSEPPEQIKKTLRSLGIEYTVIPNWLTSNLNKDIVYIVPKYILPKIKDWEEFYE